MSRASSLLPRVGRRAARMDEKVLFDARGDGRWRAQGGERGEEAAVNGNEDGIGIGNGNGHVQVNGEGTTRYGTGSTVNVLLHLGPRLPLLDSDTGGAGRSMSLPCLSCLSCLPGKVAVFHPALCLLRLLCLLCLLCRAYARSSSSTFSARCARVMHARQ